MSQPTRRVNVTRDKLEDIAFQNHTQIELSEIDNTATTRVGNTEFWAELGVIW